MKRITPLLLVIYMLFLTGCAAYAPSITYEPTQQLLVGTTANQSIVMGNFSDNRGTNSYWLGAIRNGFGIPIKELLTEKTTSEVIQTAFTEALEARDITVSKSPAQIEIQGTILKFDCSAMMNYEAHADLQINVVSLPAKAVIFSKSYRTDNSEAGFGLGLYGGYKDLGLLAQKTLNETIDKFFADPAFVAAITNAPNHREPSDAPSVPGRLQTLDQLKAKGLVSDSEYEVKRREILEAF